MKGMLKGNQLKSPRRIARELYRRLNRLGTGVAEEALPLPSVRHKRLQLSRQCRHLLVIEIRTRHVDQTCGLFLNHANDIRMTMPGGTDGDAGAEVQEQVSVDILHSRAHAL